MNGIELGGVVKWFGATRVLDGVDLSVPEGSITAVLGASGSGKTTLLRIIAGFEHADVGWVTIGGRVVDDGERFVRSQERGVGYVPQEGALFPHLTVAGNVNFGVARGERHRTGELIDMVGLAGLARRYPHQLSGGQQQRVALARALAIRPSVVLLDEPFSSLDAALRVGLRRDVARVLARTGTTAVLVTHDQDEALALADRVALLRDGKVVASGTPHGLYREPPDPATATSIGEANLLTGDVHDGVARCVLGDIPVESPAALVGPSRLLLRPEQLRLHHQSRPDATPATVVDHQFHGHDMLVEVLVDQPHRQQLLVRAPSDLTVARGTRVWVETRGPARAWPLEDGDRRSSETLWHQASVDEGRARPGGTHRPDVATGRGGRHGRRGPAPHRGRRRVVVLVGAVVVGALLFLGLHRGSGSSPSAIGPVVFHAVVQTTGRVNMTDPYVDRTTAKGVSSCARAATTGDQPSVGPGIWSVPTPPYDNTVEIEVGTIGRGYHGPGRYPKSALVLGDGVMGIGQEDYNLASSYARTSMTVNADGSGDVSFVHAPGDDDVPGPGWHGGITGTITWTCSS